MDSHTHPAIIPLVIINIIACSTNLHSDSRGLFRQLLTNTLLGMSQEARAQ